MPIDQSVPASAALGQLNDAPPADVGAIIIGQLQELLMGLSRDSYYLIGIRGTD
jgi:hypothetical protein